MDNDAGTGTTRMIIDSLDEYQRLALRTWLPGRVKGHCLGLIGEAGEVVDLIKKIEYHGHVDTAHEKMISELGDVLWYAAVVTHDASLNSKWDGPPRSRELSDLMGFLFFEDLQTAVTKPYTTRDCYAVRIVKNAVLVDESVKGQNLDLVALGLCTILHDIASIAWLSEQTSLQTVAERNVEKLVKRYPEGFSEERSQNRGAA